MLNYKLVAGMFARLKDAGIVSPAAGENQRYGPDWRFLSRYPYLDAEELRAVEQKLLELERWPALTEMDGIVAEVLGENAQGLDYKESLVQGEDEGCDDYFARLGERLFPKKPPDWWQANGLSLRLLYMASNACTCCNGECHYGNKLVGQVAKHNDRLVLKVMAGHCAHFKHFAGEGQAFEPAVAKSSDTAVPEVEKHFSADRVDYAEAYPKEAMEQLTLNYC